MSAMLARIGRLLACLLLGVVVGGVGTVMHRSVAPWGLVLGLFVLVSAGLFARAWEGWGGTGALAAGWYLAVMTMWVEGPGGDVLVPALGPWGTLWILGGTAALAAPLLAPARWFR